MGVLDNLANLARERVSLPKTVVSLGEETREVLERVLEKVFNAPDPLATLRHIDFILSDNSVSPDDTKPEHSVLDESQEPLSADDSDEPMEDGETKEALWSLNRALEQLWFNKTQEVTGFIGDNGQGSVNAPCLRPNYKAPEETGERRVILNPKVSQHIATLREAGKVGEVVDNPNFGGSNTVECIVAFDKSNFYIFQPKTQPDGGKVVGTVSVVKNVKPTDILPEEALQGKSARVEAATLYQPSAGQGQSPVKK